MTNHTITLYPTLVKRLVARGWVQSETFGAGLLYKRRGKYTWIVVVNCALNRATFSRYERLNNG